MKPGSFSQQTMYQIRIRQTLNRPVTDFVIPVSVEPQENGETLLVGQFADQPALRGFLNQLWDLNFTVLLVEQIDTSESRSPLQRMIDQTRRPT